MDDKRTLKRIEIRCMYDAGTAGTFNTVIEFTPDEETQARTMLKDINEGMELPLCGDAVLVKVYKRKANA